MNDDEMLAAMRTSVSGITESMTDVRLERPVSTIQAQARGHRLRRSLAGIGAGGVAVGVGLALAAGGSSAGGGSTAGARAVHVNLDAWSVNTLRSGLVYLDVRQLQDPVLLRQALAEAGVPAVVTFGKFCTAPGGGDTVDLRQILGKFAVGGEPRLTINPAGIPHGSELSIGIVPAWKGGVRSLDASFGVVKTGTRLTCGQPDTIQKGDGKQGPSGPAGNAKVGKGTAGNGKVANGTAGNGTVKTGFSS